MNTDNRTPSTLVWDVPVRVFHWLLVLCFAGAWLTAESEHWRLVHVTLGYTMAGLVAFRVLWGLVGTRYARFASFVRGPSAVLGYLKSLIGRHPEHHTGHNPAGALAIVAGLFAVVPAIVRRVRDATPSGPKLRLHPAPRNLPDVRFADPQGAPTSLAAFRGRVVLLNVWATWCPPCREEMPTLAAPPEIERISATAMK